MPNIVFKTPYSPSEKIFTKSGDFTRPTFKAVLEKNGEIHLEQDGVELVYEKIQSFKDSVDINVIVERFAAGDTYALEQSIGQYGDFVEVPRSYMDVLNAIVDARNVYEKSGEDITFEEYVGKLLSPSVVKAEETIEENVGDETNE